MLMISLISLPKIWHYYVLQFCLLESNKVLLTPAVFPEPVCAMPTISLPDITMGQDWAWMAVGACQLLRRIWLIT
jgi:hypothetical protein